MDSLKNRRGKWYARVQWRDEFYKMKEKKIPLRTESKATALTRVSTVNKYEDDIKSGLEFSFPWINDEGETKVVRYVLNDAIEEYLKYLQNNGSKKSTIERAYYCFLNLKKVLGEKFPVERIGITEIERFKAYHKGRLTDNGINIVLTRIRAFVNWLADTKGILKSAPKVRFIKVPKHPPRYLKEADLNAIMGLKWLDKHYKDVFKLYWETGARLREIFHGSIDGRWLVVNAEDSKSGMPREILLQQHHIPTIHEMHQRWNESKANFKTFTLRYSKMFKKVAVSIRSGDLHFHNLRDTFAVMRYIETRDIYQVSKELGHSSVKVTEKYANFNIRRLEIDHPSLGQLLQKEHKTPLKDTKMKDTSNLKVLDSEEK